jgi:hypothetical protein
MNRRDCRQLLTLAIHPNARGYGWMVFEGELAPYDWGLAVVKGEKNSKCLTRIDATITRLQPQTLILEAFDQGSSGRRTRIVRLCHAIVALASDRGVQIAIYSKAQVQFAFAPLGARTRQEIAEAVARHFDQLRHRLPAKRKAWQAEDRRLSLFCATALLLTHFQLGASSLFDQLTE